VCPLPPALPVFPLDIPPGFLINNPVDRPVFVINRLAFPLTAAADAEHLQVTNPRRGSGCKYGMGTANCCDGRSYQDRIWISTSILYVPC
jgi:hypothetical protein